MRRWYSSRSLHLPVVISSSSFSAIEVPMPGISRRAFTPPAR